MKKLKKLTRVFKPFIWLFSVFYRLVDKLIIAPVSKLIFKLTGVLKNNNKTIESILYRTNSLVFLSLAFALMLFFLVDRQIISITRSNAEILPSIAVVAEYNREEYFIEGIPETVSVTMIGRASDLFLARQLPATEIRLDLTGYSEGTHRVALNYAQQIGTIRYQVDPSVITIVVHPKVNATRTLSADILNLDSLDSRLVIEGIELERDEVVIKGPGERLDEVASVKALIDVNELTDQSIGTTSVDNVPIRAFDQDGVRVEVEIVPATVSATVTIASPSREVPIRVIPNGQVAFGMAISSMNTNRGRVTIYGNEEVIRAINYVPVHIDVDGLNRNREFNERLRMPLGVRSMSVNNVTINVTLGTESTRTLNNVMIEHRNLGSGLTVQAVSRNDIMVPIIVRGDRTVLDNLDSSTVTAYVDLRDFRPGTHTVTVHVTGTDTRLTYQAQTTRVNLRIVRQ